MDQFHDGDHVWLRSRVRGTYLRADADGVGVSLSRRRASLKAAWAVHLCQGDDPDDQYVLLRSAAYGRYLAATNTRAPLVLGGERVALRNYDQPPKLAAIRWQAARFGPGNDILLRHVGRYFRYLRANGKYLRWINGVSVDEDINITDMMQWVVEPIPARQGMPGLPGPIRVSSPCPLLYSSRIAFGGTYRLREIVSWMSSIFIQSLSARITQCVREQFVVLFWPNLRFSEASSS
jgi:hypothetical protein